MLERVWRKGNPLALLVGMQIDTATMENGIKISLKTRNKTTIIPSNPMLRHIPWGKKVKWSHSVVSDSLWPHGRRSSWRWDFPGKNIGGVAISFCRGSSGPRDRTWVSHMAGIFFTIWATREFRPWEITSFPKVPTGGTSYEIQSLLEAVL